MESNIEWTQTNRSARAFIYKNQKYGKRCSNEDGSEIWVCCNKSCGVSIVLLNGIIKRYLQEHSHDEIQHSSEVRNLLQNIYIETKNDLLTPITELYRQNLVQYKRKKGTPEDVPIFNYIRSTAYRRRSSVLPPIPKTLEDIVIPDSLKFLENGDPFIIFDNPASNRIITLSSPQALIELSRSEWEIHPFIHIAMRGRKQEHYELLFQGLFDYANKNNIKLQPISIMFDFEQAASNGFLSTFKHSSVLYCHFHCCRSIWRQVQKLGFASSFQDKSAKRELANLFGLPLIPLQYIFTVLEKIASQLLLQITDIETLLQYFSNTYLYGSKFPSPRWNHFSSIGFTHRTNNALEGYHRSINARNAPHPNIWKYILLKRELDEQTLISVSQELKQKHSTKHQRKLYRDHDNRLIEAKELLVNRQIDLLEYQRRIRSLTY